ncbi:MAG: glycoside hydrolase family 32 protein [Tepidisphaeraceae bacterium]
MRFPLWTLAPALLTLTAVAGAADDIPLLRGGYDGWTVTGEAFGREPVSDEQTLRQLEIENAAGQPVISSERDGDRPRGTLASAPFTIERKFIAFRIAGGDYEHWTFIRLLVGGKVVRQSTGWNRDRLAPETWNVSAFMGKAATIEIVDNASGDWGHINVSDLVQTDAPEKPALDTGPLYREALRPQFHFTVRQFAMNRLNPREHEEGWINDLNGLIYYQGTWHLFAQRWATCWLHATSTDLVHWTEHEPAFWEDDAGVGSQSGHCVVDYANTSGLSKDPKNPPMVAFWSKFDNRSQCISYSLDAGKTWTKYEKNPVFEFAERDPKVFWYERGKHWVMVLYGDSKYHILNSPDLLHWTDTHHPIADCFECPDLFQLPVDGDVKNTKWVLVQGNGRYTIGDFDGQQFTEQTPRRVSDPGNFYATQSFHNTNTGDGRRVQLAWVQHARFPDMPFSQMISFPCELSLHTTTDGIRMFRTPVKEIERLHAGTDEWREQTLQRDRTLKLERDGREFHLKADVSLEGDAKLVFHIRGQDVVVSRNQIESGQWKQALLTPIRNVELLIDRTSIEVFANDGEASITRFVLMDGNGIAVTARDGDVGWKSLAIHPLKSAWPDVTK